MKTRLSVIRAMIRKDIKSLLPLILISLIACLAVPLIATMDLSTVGGDNNFWAMLQANISWLGFFLGVMLMVSVLQRDPADSLNHDWLTRPLRRSEWAIAKALFLALVFVLPVLLARFLVNLSAGISPGLALNYAVGIEEFEAVFMLPLFLMAALLTPSFRRWILLITAVFFVFLLPGWSVTRPLLMALGIELSGDFSTLMWVQVTLVVVAGLVGAGFIYWFQYCQRKHFPAYVSLWTAVLVMFLAIYPPRWLYSWDKAFALHAWMVNDDLAELDDQVLLDPLVACFPAAYLDDSYLSEQQSAMLAQAAWSPEVLANVEPGAMMMATPVGYREVLTEWFARPESGRDQSIEWRLDRLWSRAHFSADSLAEDIPLQLSVTALDRYAPISASHTNYWLVPPAAIDQLANDPTTRLTLEYDAVLLSPRTFELPVDGERHRFPELGSCKAELDSVSNQITVECLKRGVQPELVSVQYIGMDSSRVDSYVRTNFTHDWVESLKRERYELTLEAAGLTDTSSILITAFNAERVLQKQLVVPGLLGGDLEACPLPGQLRDDIGRTSSWSDKSPHEVSFVTVERGVRLEVLDWREEIKPNVPTLLLLPGLGATAHSYDNIAPQLGEHYNVLAMTRRGTGASSKPGSGYTIDQLSADILQVMDTFELESAFLVGHSFGGEELSYLGAHHPQRVDGLIYLDAAYDRVTVNSGNDFKRMRELDMQLPLPPLPRPAEIVSYEAMHAYGQRTGRGRLPEGEMIASYDLTTGSVKHDALYMDALMAGIVAPDYRSITVPALALYAMPASPAALTRAWYPDDPALQAKLNEMFEIDQARKMAEMTRFETEVADSTVMAINDADHWIFLSHENEVLQAMRDFIEKTTGLPIGLRGGNPVDSSAQRPQ